MRPLGFLRKAASTSLKSLAPQKFPRPLLAILWLRRVCDALPLPNDINSLLRLVGNLSDG